MTLANRLKLTGLHGYLQIVIYVHLYRVFFTFLFLFFSHLTRNTLSVARSFAHDNLQVQLNLLYDFFFLACYKFITY